MMKKIFCKPFTFSFSFQNPFINTTDQQLSSRQSSQSGINRANIRHEIAPNTQVSDWLNLLSFSLSLSLAPLPLFGWPTKRDVLGRRVSVSRSDVTHVHNMTFCRIIYIYMHILMYTAHGAYAHRAK